MNTTHSDPTWRDACTMREDYYTIRTHLVQCSAARDLSCSGHSCRPGSSVTTGGNWSRQFTDRAAEPALTVSNPLCSWRLTCAEKTAFVPILDVYRGGIIHHGARVFRPVRLGLENRGTVQGGFGKEDTMSERIAELYRLMLQKPPDYRYIRTLLSESELTQAELTELAGNLLDASFYGYEEYYYVIINEVDEPENIIGNQNSDYIYYNIKLLLEFGLDPNRCVQEESCSWLLLEQVPSIENPRECLRLAALLLEHGADPNASAPDDDTAFTIIDFDIWFYELSNGRYYEFFLFWLLLIAYGGNRDGEAPVTFFGENKDVGIFKDYERFTYQIECQPTKSNRFEGRFLYIIDKETGEDVAYADMQ